MKAPLQELLGELGSHAAARLLGCRQSHAWRFINNEGGLHPQYLLKAADHFGRDRVDLWETLSQWPARRKGGE